MIRNFKSFVGFIIFSLSLVGCNSNAPHEHKWGNPTYVWAEDFSRCTAESVCEEDTTHRISETKISSYRVSNPPGCETDGEGIYTVNFDDNKFTTQIKSVAIPATDHNRGTPTYEWNMDFSKCTATKICLNNSAHKVTETVGTTYKDIVPPSGCENSGKRLYTSNIFNNKDFLVQTKEVDIPAKGHNRGEISYSWSEDNSTCTASRTCLNDSSHIESETVNTTYKIIEEATCEETGLGRYTTSSFTNKAFSVQTKDIVINATGHHFVKNKDTLVYECDHDGCDETSGRDYELYITAPELHVGDLFKPRGLEYSFKNDDGALAFGYVVYTIGNKIIAKNSDSDADYYFPADLEGQSITATIAVGIYDETNIKYIGESSFTNLDNVDVYVNKTLATKEGRVSHNYWERVIQPALPSSWFYVYQIKLGTLLPRPIYKGEYPVLSEDGKTVTYGLYPNTYINDATLVSELDTLTTPEPNGWYLHNDEYYAKVEANPANSKCTFNNGTSIVGGKKYWFKCEPIVWNVLSIKDEEYYLLSNSLLDAHNYYVSTTDVRTIDGKTIYPSNYEYSDIRSWLNNDFYNKAFSLGSSFIKTTTVDNSDAVTGAGNETYASSNTQDKVFLPSYLDYLNPDYGFIATGEASATRSCLTTEYARALGAWYEIHATELLYCGSYWTRSPFITSAAYYFLGDGFGDVSNVNWSDRCVRPAIKISI